VTSSSSEIFPCSTSCMIAAAVNCFVTDPISYTACSGVATSSSRSAFPYPFITTVSRPRTTAIDSPAARPVASAAAAIESTTAAARARSATCAPRQRTERERGARDAPHEREGGPGMEGGR
jgi:hypothetical protein